MAKIVIDKFNGIAPKVPPLKAGDSIAQEAENVRLDRMRLEPMSEASIDAGDGLQSDTETFYRYLSNWIEYSEEVSIVPVPIIDDALSRIVIADSSYPKMRSGSATYRLGLPAPADASGDWAGGAPSIEIGDYTVPSGTAISEDISYVVTFVDSFGYESPPSAPSNVVTRERNTDVTITLNHAAPTGDYNFSESGGYTALRLYRSNTGSAATAYQYVGQWVGTLLPDDGDAGLPLTIDDTVDNEDLQEVLPSATWIGPPNDGYNGYVTDTSLYPNGPLRQIIALPGGVLAGFSGNTICFSEPYLPHVWPLAYRASIPVDAVGMAPLPEGCVVLTESRPFFFLGSHPSTMQQIEVKGEPAPCTDRRSIVNMGNSVIYTSPVGLISISTSGVQNLTEQLYTPEQWSNTYNLSEVKAFLHEGRYVATLSDGTSTIGMIYSPRDGLNALTTTDETFECSFRDAQEEYVYIKRGLGRLIWENGGTDKTYTWRSKIFSDGRYKAYTVCRVEKEAGSCTINIYGDGNLVKSKDITSTDLFRLPSGKKYVQWEIEIVGNATVEYVVLADSMSEVI